MAVPIGQREEPVTRTGAFEVVVVVAVVRVLVLEVMVVLVLLNMPVASCVALSCVIVPRVVLCVALDIFAVKIRVGLVMATAVGSHLQTDRLIRVVPVARTALPPFPHAIFSPGIFFNGLN